MVRILKFTLYNFFECVDTKISQLIVVLFKQYMYVSSIIGVVVFELITR